MCDSNRKLLDLTLNMFSKNSSELMWQLVKSAHELRVTIRWVTFYNQCDHDNKTFVCHDQTREPRLGLKLCLSSNSRHYSHPAQSMTAGGDQLSEPLAPEEEGAEYGECGEEPENPNKAREAFLYCMLGVCFSIGVSVWIRYDQSTEAMMEFYAGYLVEMSLSLDNLFAFYLVFKYFKVILPCLIVKTSRGLNDFLEM